MRSKIIVFNFVEEPFLHVGCYDYYNALGGSFLSSLEGEIGDNYATRTDAIEKCYRAARDNYYEYFAIYWGGHCYGERPTSVNLRKSSTYCASANNGKGYPSTHATSLYQIMTQAGKQL